MRGENLVEPMKGLLPQVICLSEKLTLIIIIRLLTLLYIETFMHHPFKDNHTYFQKKNK